MVTNTTPNFNHNVWKAAEGREERQKKAAYASVTEYKYAPDRVYWHTNTKARSKGIRFPKSLLVKNQP